MHGIFPPNSEELFVDWLPVYYMVLFSLCILLPVTISGRTASVRCMEVIFNFNWRIRIWKLDKHEVVAKQEGHTPQSPCSKKCISKEEIASSTFVKGTFIFASWICRFCLQVKFEYPRSVGKDWLVAVKPQVGCVRHLIAKQLGGK